MSDDTGYSGYQYPPSAYANKDNPSDQGYGDSKDASSPYSDKSSMGKSAVGPDVQNQATASPSSGLGNGVNLQPSYSNNGDADLGWAFMKNYPKIFTVRIEIEPGQEKNAQRWIKEAVTNGYKVIATYHKSKAPLGTDNVAELKAAAVWWVKYYSQLSASGSFIVNLMNEWGSHTISSNDYAAAYNMAITTLRTVYSGPVIIDLPGWGQGTHTAAEAVKGTNGIQINDTNIFLSAHIYPDAYNGGKKRNMINADLDELASTGRVCMIGEFGDYAKTKAVSWSALVDYAKSKEWTVIGWAWGGDNAAGVGSSLNMNMIKSNLMATKGEYDPYKAGSNATYTESSYFKTIHDKL